MTDRKAIQKFIRTSLYSPSTARAYTWILHRMGRWLALKNMDFDKLTPEDFIDFLDEQNWGDNMRSQAQGAARAFVKAAFGDGHPLLEMRVRKPKPRPQRTLTEEELACVLDSLNLDTATGIRNLAMIYLLLDTGLRSSELCRLTLEDIDLDEQELHVKIKGGRWGGAVFSEETADSLWDWLTLRTDIAHPNVKSVFVGVMGTTPGRPITRDGLRSIFRRIAQKAGVKHFSTHAFRRTFATLATKAGAPSRVVQEAGRWSGIEQVERYTQELPDRSIDPYLPVRQLLAGHVNSENSTQQEHGENGG